MLLRLVAVASVLTATAGLAHADMGMLPGDDQLTWNTMKLWLHESECVANGGYCSALEDPVFANADQCFSASGACGGRQDLALPTNSVISPLYAFNYAHCSCSRVQQTLGIDGFYESTFAIELDFTGTTPSSKTLDIWVGTGCDDPVSRQNTDAGLCHQITLSDVLSITGLMTNKFAKPEIPVYDLIEAKPSAQMGGVCESIQGGNVSVWAMGQINSGTYDYSVSVPVSFDTAPPTLPQSFTVQGAESAIQVSWTPPAEGTLDVFAYQALCEVYDPTGALDETPGTSSHPTPKYQTPQMLCGAGDLPTVTATTLDQSTLPVDAPTVSPGNNMIRLDPKFLCGEAVDPTATSMRIEGLKDGTSYVVTFVVMDKSGNVTGTYFTSPVTPKPARDFWQDLHDEGSTAEGGFCLIAETFGDDNPLTQLMRGFRDGTLGGTPWGRALTRAYYATLGKLGWLVHGHILLRVLSALLLLPLIAFALLWHLLGLPLLVLIALALRFRKKLSPKLVAALALLVPGIASAQQPYWEDDAKSSKADDNFADQKDDVSWHVGIRLGPYVPQIDAQLGGGKHPYQDMFGSSSAWLPMLDVDYILWNQVGQLGVGFSLGYMSKSAHAWAVCTPDQIGCIDTPGDPHRTRASGDENSFHLIPTAVTATYRFTYLDDEYGIPVVPYGRGGLAYYLWYSDGPNGDASVAMTPSGTSTTAKGASLGLVGSVGIAIRAERIDSDAARSMRDSGIEHAGFYAEVQEAWVNGFSNSKKLSVGDATWFAGVDFEF